MTVVLLSQSIGPVNTAKVRSRYNSISSEDAVPLRIAYKQPGLRQASCIDVPHVMTVRFDQGHCMTSESLHCNRRHGDLRGIVYEIKAMPATS